MKASTAVILSISICCCTGTSPLVAQPANSPWPMFAGDARHSGQSPYAGRTDYGLKWSYILVENIAGNYVSSPAIGDKGMVYAGTSDNRLWCLRSDGAFLWSYKTGDGLQYYTPATDLYGRVYAASSDYRLYCLTTNGAFTWSYNTGAQIEGSPTIGKNSEVYLGGYDNLLFCLNSNGALSWTYEADNALDCTVNGAAVIDNNGKIYMSSRDWCLYCLNADGSLSWRYTANGVIRSSPAIGRGGDIYLPCWDNRLYSISSSGYVNWTYYIGGNWTLAASAGDDGTVYAGTNDSIFTGKSRLIGLNSSGSLSWSYLTGSLGDIRASATIDAERKVFVGSDDGHIYSFNPDGSLSWSYDTTGWVRSTPAIGSDGTVHVGSNNSVWNNINHNWKGILFAFGPPPPPTPTIPPQPWRVLDLRYGPPAIWINGLLPPGPWGPLGPFPPDPEPYLQPYLYEQLLMDRADRLEALMEEENHEIQPALEREIIVLELGMELILAIENGEADYADALGREVLIIALETHLWRLEKDLAETEDEAERQHPQLEMDLLQLDLAFIRAEQNGEWDLAEELRRQIQELETRW